MPINSFTDKAVASLYRTMLRLLSSNKKLSAVLVSNKDKRRDSSKESALSIETTDKSDPINDGGLLVSVLDLNVTYVFWFCKGKVKGQVKASESYIVIFIHIFLE
jgi:hypothetical protein